MVTVLGVVAESVMETVKEKLPALLGVPVICPPAMARPGGRFPAVTLN